MKLDSQARPAVNGSYTATFWQVR